MKSLVTLFFYFLCRSSEDEKSESCCLLLFFLLSFCLDCRLRDGTEVDFLVRAINLRQKTNLWPTIPQAEQVTP